MKGAGRRPQAAPWEPSLVAQTGVLGLLGAWSGPLLGIPFRMQKMTPLQRLPSFRAYRSCPGPGCYPEVPKNVHCSEGRMTGCPAPQADPTQAHGVHILKLPLVCRDRRVMCFSGTQERLCSSPGSMQLLPGPPPIPRANLAILQPCQACHRAVL